MRMQARMRLDDVLMECSWLFFIADMSCARLRE